MICTISISHDHILSLSLSLSPRPSCICSDVFVLYPIWLKMAKPSWATRTNLKQKRTNSDTVPSWAHRAKRLKGPSKIDTPRGWSLKTVAAKLALILPAWWCKLCIEAAHRSADQSTIFGVEAFSGRGMLARAFSNHIGPICDL